MPVPFQHWGATPAEIASGLPGDDLVSGAATGTRSLSIRAEATVVFDFLSQMGFGRAGWYSYDWIDNLGRRSAEDLRPEWMVTRAGELVPGGPIDFVAEIVDRPQTLVLNLPQQHLLGHRIGFSLAYQLHEEDTSGSAPTTRVVSRARVLVSGPTGSVLTRLVLLGDGVMVRRQLIGLKTRAESLEA